MAASNAYGSNFQSDGSLPVIQQAVSGVSIGLASETIPTTSLDDIGDFFGLIAVPEGRSIQALVHTAGDLDTHATETLDMDIILRVYDSAGSATDTILYNAGTAFEDAVTTPVWTLLDQAVSGSADGYGVIGLKINTVAATPAAANFTLKAFWQ